MDAATAIWLGLTLAAPLTLVPEIALIRLMHKRRSAWHPLDVLIVSLLVGQLCCTLVTLGLSAAALARHAGLLLGTEPLVPADQLLYHRTPLCATLISFWAAAHTLHAATLTSMAVDRAMTVRWPYKYRVGVRRTQVRYHVVVLAVVSLLVGVATLFASNSNNGRHTIGVTSHHSSLLPYLAVGQKMDLNPNQTSTAFNTVDDRLMAKNPVALAAATVAALMETSCSFLPYTFDSRFSLFWLCLHGVLFLTTITAAVVILITRMMIRFSSDFSGRLGLAGSGSDMRTLGNASDGSSATLPLPSSSAGLPTLPAPPPPPRYTPGPVACLTGTASVSPLNRSGLPASMFGSTDKTFMNLLHHESGLLAVDHRHHKPEDFLRESEVGCCGGGSWNRQRHSTVAAVLIVAYLTHHLPLLALTTMGTFFYEILPTGWPFSAMVLALTLFSGLVFMAVLVFIDPVLYTWMMDSLRPSSRRTDRHRHQHQRSPVTSESATLEPNLAPMKIDEETRYRMSQIYSQEPTEAKFPLTNGSLFVHLMNPSSGDGHRANRRPSRMGVSAYDHRPHRGVATSNAVMSAHIPELVYPEATKPPLMTFMSRARILASNGSLKSTDIECTRQLNIEPFYCDPLTSIDGPPSFANVDVMAPVHQVSTQVGSAAPLSSNKFRSHEPIYASLSETLSSCHTLDSLGGLGEPPLRAGEAQRRVNDFGDSQQDDDDDDGDNNDNQVEDEEEDEGSATESAGDDFEFHNIRTSRQTLITNSTATSRSNSGTAAPEAICGLEDLRPRSRVARSATYRILCNGLDVKCTGKHDKNVQEQDKNSAESATVAATSESQHGIVTCVTIRIGNNREDAFVDASSSLRRSKLLTSLSMNDIDVIGHNPGDEDELDQHGTPIQVDVPTRSDSLFSLYVAGDDIKTTSSSSPMTSSSTALAELSSSIEDERHVVLHKRKKSTHRSRTAVLQRFQQRSRRGRDDRSLAHMKTGHHVVSIAALKAALSQSPLSYLDNGDIYPSAGHQPHQSKTVFVSDYI